MAIKNNKFQEQKTILQYAYGITTNLCYTNLIVLDVDDLPSEESLVLSTKRLSERLSGPDILKMEVLRTSKELRQAKVDSFFDHVLHVNAFTTTYNYHVYIYFTDKADRREEFKKLLEYFNGCNGYYKNALVTNSSVVRVSQKFNCSKDTRIFPVYKIEKIGNKWTEFTFSEQTQHLTTSDGTIPRSSSLNLRS